MNNNRYVSIDIARALFTLEIIAFWHMLNYLPHSMKLVGIYENIAELLTISSLSGFAYISGYCLNKYHINSVKDVFFFYKRRIIRFYFFFFLSVLSLYVGSSLFSKVWFVSISQIFVTLSGLSTFYSIKPPTVWFISMLLLFYMITPFILYLKSNSKRLISGLLILLFFYGLHLFVFVDATFFQYFPFYLLGLLKPQYLMFKIKKNKYLTFILSFLIFILNAFFYFKFKAYPCLFFYMLIGIALCFSISFIIESYKHYSLFIFISFSSMVAYLFHRQVYQVFDYLFKLVGLQFNVIFALLVIVPLLFVASYYAQYLYNKIIFKS